MKVFSVVLLLIGAFWLAESRSTKTSTLPGTSARASKRSSIGDGSEAPKVVRKTQLLDLLRALQESIQSMGPSELAARQNSSSTFSSSIVSSGGSSGAGSSVQSGPRDPPATSSTSTVSLSSSNLIDGSGSEASISDSSDDSSTEIETTPGDSDSLGLSNLFGDNRAVLSRVLLAIVKTLLAQTGFDPASSDMNIELGEFINIVDALLSGRAIL